MTSEPSVRVRQASVRPHTIVFDTSLPWNKSHTGWYMFMRQLVLPVVFDLPYMDHEDYKELLRPLTACVRHVPSGHYVWGGWISFVNETTYLPILAPHHEPQPLVATLMLSLASVSSRFALDILGASFTPCMSSAIRLTAFLGNWSIFCVLHDSIAHWHHYSHHPCPWNMTTRRAEQQQLLTDLKTNMLQHFQRSETTPYSSSYSCSPLFRWFVSSVDHWDAYCSVDSLYALFQGFYQSGDVENTCMIYKKLVRRCATFMLVEYQHVLSYVILACLHNDCPLMLARLLDIEYHRVPPHHRAKWFRRMKRQCLWVQCMQPKPICAMRLWLLCIFCAASLDEVCKARWFPDATDWLLHHRQCISLERLSHMAGYLHMTDCDWIASTITLESSFFFELMQRGTPAHTLVRTMIRLKPFRESLCHIMLLRTELDERHIEQILSVVGRQTIIETLRPHMIYPWRYKTGYPHMHGVCHCYQLGHCCHILKQFNLFEGTGTAHNDWCIKHIVPIIYTCSTCECAPHIANALDLDYGHHGEFFLDQTGGILPTGTVPYSSSVSDHFITCAGKRISFFGRVDEILFQHLLDDGLYTTFDNCLSFLADIDIEYTSVLCTEHHPEATIELCRVVRHRIITTFSLHRRVSRSDDLRAVTTTLGMWPSIDNMPPLRDCVLDLQHIFE